MQSSPRTAGWSLAAVCAVTLALLLWLPYRFPVAPSFSDSYLFGFNNHAALLLVLAFAAAVAVCTRHWRWPQAADSPEYRLSPKYLYWALTVTLLVSAALTLAVRKLDGIEESIYLIDRLKLVLAGRAPGVDFEFAYGAFLLYGPAWLGHGFHLTAAEAYFLFWTLTNVLGVVLLYCTLQWVDVSFHLRRAAFLFFLHSPLLRCFVREPITACSASSHRFFSRSAFTASCTAPPRPGRYPRYSADPPLLCRADNDSPELALAFVCGMCLYVLCSWISARREPCHAS